MMFAMFANVRAGGHAGSSRGFCLAGKPGSPDGHTGCRKLLPQDTESGSVALADVKGVRGIRLGSLGLWLCSCEAFSMGGAGGAMACGEAVLHKNDCITKPI